MYKIPIKIYPNINYHFKSFFFGLTSSSLQSKIFHSVLTQSDWNLKPKLSFWTRLWSIKLPHWISFLLIYLIFNLNFSFPFESIPSPGPYSQYQSCQEVNATKVAPTLMLRLFKIELESSCYWSNRNEMWRTLKLTYGYLIDHYYYYTFSSTMTPIYRYFCLSDALIHYKIGWTEEKCQIYIFDSVLSN